MFQRILNIDLKPSKMKEGVGPIPRLKMNADLYRFFTVLKICKYAYIYTCIGD